MKRQNRNELLFQTAIQQLSVGLLIANKEGSITFANREFLTMSGFTEDEIINTLASYLFENDIKLLEDWQGEVLVKMKNHDMKPHWVHVTTIKDHNGIPTDTMILFSPCQQCSIDSLTKLPNRHMLEQELQKALIGAREKDSLLAILFLDLDRFKFVNDTLGHSSGDSLLKQVTGRLKTIVNHRHLLARLGGDEFVCLLKDLQSEKEAELIANQIIDAFREPFLLRGTEIYITTSIGLSLYPYDGDDIETLVTNADSAMYRAKKKGRNQIEKAVVEINAGAFERLLIENNLRKALIQEEFFLVYQPQLDLNQNEVIAFEALIRWDHPDLGIIPPSEFIPIAEETGLIIPIGDWVLQTACQKLKEWQIEGYSSLRIAVNLAAQQFLQKRMIEKLKKILKEYNINPSLLELEITESMVMHDVDSAVSILNQLRDLGVRVSIDDFGTGYSSLNYLRNFPVDNLKIDRSFIIDIETNPSSKALTNAIATLAHDLNLKVVVEGVETLKQLTLVKSSSCDIIQGYYFSKPLHSDLVLDFISTFNREAVYHA